MQLVLIAVLAALATFAAVSLVIFMVVGGRSTAESRLAALRPLSEVGETPDEDVAGLDKFSPQDLIELITRPLAPFRDWLRSRDDELSYRLSLAGFRNPGDTDTFLSCKLLG